MIALALFLMALWFISMHLDFFIKTLLIFFLSYLVFVLLTVMITTIALAPVSIGREFKTNTKLREWRDWVMRKRKLKIIAKPL